MKAVLCFALVVALAPATPAYAQLGTLNKLKQRAEQVKKFADVDISEADERKIGDGVSEQLVERFGVVQDPKLTKYVTLIGMVVAQESAKPKLDWRFVVLDTDGVNAYAAPGGIVHITRGALAMIKSEAELAAVLGHELTHVTERHTVRSIQRSKLVDAGTDELTAQGGLAASLVDRIADQAYQMVLENDFGRDQEMTSDKIGVTLANKAGYSPAGLAAFLTKLGERNKDAKEKNGLFATHPQLKDRVDTLGRIVKEQKLTATAMGEPRYAANVKVSAKPMADIAMAPAGAKGVTGASGPSATKTTAAKEEKKEEQPKEKKRGFGLGKIASSLTKGSQAENTQASASAGGKMAGPDTNAVGGPNKTPVRVTVTAAEIAEFKKGIA